MSSKFSNAGPIQKPPRVCIKPPPGTPYALPSMTEQPIEGYVEYLNPDTPHEGGMIGPIRLLPNGPADTWFGTAVARIFRIDLLMAADAAHTRLSFRLDWYVSNTHYDTIILNNLKARSWSPFDSGQVTPMRQPQDGRIGWHLWF